LCISFFPFLGDVEQGSGGEGSTALHRSEERLLREFEEEVWLGTAAHISFLFSSPATSGVPVFPFGHSVGGVDIFIARSSTALALPPKVFSEKDRFKGGCAVLTPRGACRAEAFWLFPILLPAWF